MAFNNLQCRSCVSSLAGKHYSCYGCVADIEHDIYAMLLQHSDCRVKQLVEHVTASVLMCNLCTEFRVATVEKMSLAEQIKLYSEAQILIMTHGASIANIIFMSPVSAATPTYNNLIYRKHVPQALNAAQISMGRSG